MTTTFDRNPFLTNGTLSLLFHLVLLGALSLMVSFPVPQTDAPVVNVTLVQRPPVEPSRPPLEDPPHMLQAQRQPIRSTTQSLPIHSLELSSLRAKPSPVMQTIPTSPHQPHNPSQTKRVLRDSKAADILIMQSLLKMAKLPPNRQTTSPIPASSPSLHSHIPMTLLQVAQHNWTQDASSVVSRLSKRNTARRQPFLLPAHPSGHKSPTGSKVHLGRSIPPVYPRIARKRGWEGTVFIRVLVQPDGSPGKTTVKKSSGFELLDKAALKAVRSWRFIPARDGNIPIKSMVEIPIHFGLRKQDTLRRDS